MMETRVNIDALRELIGTRGCVIRQQHTIPFDLGMEIMQTIGKMTMPNFTIDKHNRFAYENLVRWIISDPDTMCETPEGRTIRANLGKGIYLQGGTGTGKSMALNLARLMCRHLGVKIKISRDVAPVPLAWKTERADDICDTFSQDGDLSRWKNIPVLCIQDLGSEPGEILYMGNRRRVMGSIIEARGDMFDRVTLISTNIRIDRVGEIYGQRVHSRLQQMCNILTLNGPDRRI